MRLYFIALQFLTIIPLPFSVRCEEKDLGRSMAFFPLVGLTLGGMLVGTDFILERLLPRQIVDLLLIVVMTVVTGALHLDGLADVCDGLAARGGREKFLAVMKDSQIGAVGAAALILGLLLKYEALSLIPTTVKHETLLFFPTVARFSQVLLAVGAQGARRDGLGSLFVGGAGLSQFAAAGAVSLAAAGLLLGMKGICCLLAVSILAWGARVWSHRRLGGITGDVIGCVSEVNEILCLIVLLALSAPYP